MFSVKVSRWFTFARGDDVLLLVQVVFVALYVAAAALQGRRRLEDVPQRLGARLAVGGEVVEGGDELVALVGQAVGLVALGYALHICLLPALALIGIQDLEESRRDRSSETGDGGRGGTHGSFHGVKPQCDIRDKEV